MLIFGQEIKRRHFLILISFLLVLLAIPLSVYLVQKQQIFKSRAVTTFRPPSEFEVGLEVGEQSDTGKVNLVAESKAKWVRLNFIGDDWTASSSATKKYNQIIDAYRAKRINILGLIGAQSVAGGYDRAKPDDFTKKYVDAADAIINRFGDRVKAYELFNEPNDWAGGTNAQVPPDLFAKYLGRIYRKIKIDQKKLDIILNSGPVFSHDQDTGASYLEQTYSAGKNLSDPEANWTKIKAEAGSYPLDGIGYHIYVAQGMNDQGQVEPKIRENLNAFKSIIATLDPGKKIWISEFGWGTGIGRVTEEVQALNLEKAFALFKSEPTVRMAMWFTLMDFDPVEWGLLRGDGVKKKAWEKFIQVAAGTPAPTGLIVLPTATPSATPLQKPSPSPVVTSSPALTPSPAPVKFDLNKDNKVNSIDAGEFLKALRKGNPPKADDFNNDGVVNSLDYSMLIRNFSR